MALNLKQSNDFKSTPLYILGGMISAILFASIPTGNILSTIAMYLSPLPLIYLGITIGLYPMIIAVLTSAIALSIKSLPISLSFIFIDALPSILLSYLFLLKTSDNKKWFEIGHILTWLSLLISVFVILFFFNINLFLSSDTNLNIIETLQSYTDSMLVKFNEQNRPAVKAVFDNILPILPFSIAISMMARIIISALVANWLAKKQSKAIRNDIKYINLEIPSWNLILVAIVGLISLIGNINISYLSRNLGFIMLIPLFFMGLNVIHQNVEKTKSPKLILTIFYIILTFSGYLTILFLSGLGIIDYFLKQKNVSKITKEKK